MSESTSSSKWNSLKVVCVVLLVGLVVTMSVSGILFYYTFRAYYYEQNMHRYAAMNAFYDLLYGLNGLAIEVNRNRSALNHVVLEANVIHVAADRLAYMDTPHSQTWSNISNAYQSLSRMAFLDYFSNESTGFLDQVYVDILSLETTISNTLVGAKLYASTGDYLYNRDANMFMLNETAVQEAGQISWNLIQLIRTNT